MSTKEKVKKSIIRRILKWTGITFLLVLIALIIIPIIFKDDIKKLVIKEANKSLLADLSLGEFDLTFISTFPNMTIKLVDMKLTGRNEFKGVDLVNIKEFTAHVGFWSVIGGDKVEISEINLDKPSFDVRILSNGKANYDIVKPDSIKTPEEKSEPSKFELKLNEYSINNANIRYDDQPGDMFTELVNMTHSGTGNLTADVIDFNTTTHIDEMTFEMGGISYLKKVKTDLLANILMEFTEKTSKFTLKKNEVTLNALHFSVDGFYEMLEGYDNMDLKLKADKATFKDFLSLIPTFYQSGYESMIAQGNLAFKGEVKGRMDDKNMPAWDFGLQVDKAKIKYSALPGSIDNIVVKAGSKFAGGEDMDKMTVDVQKFHADFVGNVVDATLTMRNPMTDPMIDSKIIAKVDLATLGKVIPMAEGESYNGKLDADVLVNGRMSALEKQDFEAFKSTGTVLLSDILYKSKDLPNEVSIKKMLLRFSPQNLSLESLDAKMGKSDFQMAGTIDNYLGYVFRDELLKGQFTLNSTNLDLDELMGTTATPAATNDKAAAATATALPANPEPFLIPNNIDFILTTSLANVAYSGIVLKNISGNIKMKEEVASLENLTMNAMGGTIGLKGNYDTKEHHKPHVDFGYNLKDIDIKELAENFLTIEKLAPIAKYATGKISTTFDMKSDLKASMEPIYSSLSGAGDFFSSMLKISGYKPLEKIADVLKMSKLSSQTLNDFKTNFKFENGKVSLTPFDVKLGKIITNISGSSSFERDLDYVLTMNIPKEEIPASMLKVVEDQLKKINNIVPKLNLSAIPAFLKVNVKVTGKGTDPKITTDFKEALLKATGNLKDNLVNSVKETIKDTVKAIVGKKIEEIREDLNAKKQKILDDAQKLADRAKMEGKRLADAERDLGVKAAKAAMDEAGGNPIKKKLAEALGNKAKKIAEEKAVKIENEANSKADLIMKNAREKANQVK
jgi:hypothetical protein